MKKIINPTLLLLSIFMLVLSAGCASRSTVKPDAPAAEEPLVLTDIRLQDNGIVIVSNKQFVYTMYKGNDPYRMTIDIPDMGAGIFRDKIISDKSGIAEVDPQQVDSPNRAMKITIALQSPSIVTPVYKDNTLTLTVKPEDPMPPVELTDTAGIPAAEPAPAVAKEVPLSVPLSQPVKAPETVMTSPEKPAESVISYIPRATEITAIEVNRAAEGAKVIILGNGSMMPNVFPIDERIVIDIPDVVMNAAIPTNITSPLKGIRAGRHKEKVRLVLDLREKTKFEVTAIGKTIEVALKGRTAMVAQASAIKEMPARETAKEAPSQAKNNKHREPSGLAAEMMPAQMAKEPAKEISNKDLPADNAVLPEQRYSGKKISLDFQDAEIGPIFRLLADVNGYNLVLDPLVKGKITIKLMNVPWDQALDIILNTFTLGKSIDGNILWVAPRSVFNKIADERSAAKVTQEKTEDLVQEIIRVNYAMSSDLSAAFTAGKLLSPRGTITQDTRMNTLIIKDIQKSIDKMKELVKVMDVTKPQVMIEAKIVEVSTTYSQNLGIRWGGSVSIRSGAYPVGGTFGVNTPVLTTGPGTTTPGGALGMTVGAVNALKVDLSLSALESITKAKTLSSPKILTMDNEAATIQQGTTFYIPTVSQAGTTSTPVTATLSLNVTPKITPDGFVQLKVIATDNSLQPGTAGADAVVNTKSMTTQALVKNGETLVLGGIYRRDEATSEDGVPFLSKVPGLGWLFKTRSQTGPDVKELLIFITPTIVTQQVENKQ
ncbi:MAG: type IV pilus secretin PilQ [Thermodesulfovibrionales bacterium]